MRRIAVKKKEKDARVLRMEGKIGQEQIKELDPKIKSGLDEQKKIAFDFSKVDLIDQKEGKGSSMFLCRMSRKETSLYSSAQCSNK